MNPAQRHLTILIISLFVIGASIFFYRHIALDVPLTETEVVNSWTVEANLRFQAEPGTPLKASFSIPYLPPYYAILDEYFVSRNYGVTTNLKNYNRETVWSIRRATGKQSLYYRAIFRQTDNPEPPLGKPPTLKIQELSDSKKSAVDSLSNQIRKTSADIQTFAQGTVKILHHDKEGSAKLLVGPAPNDEKVVNAAVMILNQANISALPVKGIYLHQQSKAEFKTMLAVFDEKRWVFINPKTASQGLPKNFLVWQYGNTPVYALTGGKKLQFSIAASPTPVNALSVAKIRGAQTDSQLIKFSLLQLPVSVQQTYKILLTVPIGAFIILLLRNFVGLVTFGTFMPVLIALAFRETHVVWGVFLFSLIVSIGLLVRFYLDQLRLLLVPRLAAILTVVILVMIAISIISQHLGLETGLSVALFPMVILTMTIERMCITWDERGPREAVTAGAGSLLAASIAYCAMSNQSIEYLFFAFPELLLVLLAIILWFGQYRGYRLLELIRFKVMTHV